MLGVVDAGVSELPAKGQLSGCLCVTCSAHTWYVFGHMQQLPLLTAHLLFVPLHVLFYLTLTTVLGGRYCDH